MTAEQFDKHRFGAHERVAYKKDGNIYYVAAIDFDERLFGLLMEIPGGDPTDVTWVRCENVTYVPF